MKNPKIYLAVTLVFLSFSTFQLKAGSEPVLATLSTEVIPSVRAQELTNRLEEINQMDKSALNRSEKKVYRQEVRAINKELKELGGGVYLSVGAIIIIVLLLILLL
jgi:hypothetical protein